MPYRILNSTGELDRHQPEYREPSGHRECGNCGDIILGDGFYRINADNMSSPDVKPDFLCACCARRMTATDLFDFIGVEPTAIEMLEDYYQIQEEERE